MLHAFRRTVRLLQAFDIVAAPADATLTNQLADHACRQPDHAFLLFGDQRFTYAQADALINQHAQVYRAEGLQKGDVVALLMDNRPSFLWHLFGMHRIGVVGSLINTNLKGDGLVHALRICEPKLIVVGTEHWGAMADIEGSQGVADVPVRPDLDDENPATVTGESFQDALANVSSDALPREEGAQLTDLCAYIYTSGTTGLPKAALIRHHRQFRAGAVWAGGAMRYGSGAVMYNCLPLYHSNAFLLATGSVVTAGITMALGRKFSTSRFWDEIRRHQATSFIYIGELCRYLMNAPARDDDRDNPVRVITGNGLRPDIWKAFLDRFGIARVAEFYGATEGNSVTINLGYTVGSVGRMMKGMVLARWDEQEQELVRGADGFLIEAAAGEQGLLLGRIRKGAEFDGYKDARASESKILRDAFETGDAYFNTGDLLRRDGRKNLFFVDRVGDTFRWKGENVSTTEVQESLSGWDPVDEVNVYGVSIDGMDGRAGMAALVLRKGVQFDAAEFMAHADSVLPAYARPVFVRLQQAIEITGTFKMKKGDLQKQGFDPTATDDPIYFRHPERKAYVQVDADLHAAITSGSLRL